MNPSTLPWKNDAWLGRRVLVTGSGRGIGQGCARFFAQHQAKVLLVARSQSELEDTQRELCKFTSEVDFIAVDLTEHASAAKVVGRAKSNWGGLDIVAEGSVLTGLVSASHFLLTSTPGKCATASCT